MCLAWTCACTADETVSAPSCSDGVCVVNVFASALIFPPCVDESVLVAYSQNSGATLIQCSDPSDPEENKAFIYDRRHPSASSYVFSGGRFIRPDYLPTAMSEGIPDILGPVPLCTQKGRRPAAAGDLLLAAKQPNNSQDVPYCYRIHYVVAGKGAVQVVSDGGDELPAMAPADVATWAKLQQSLAPYVDPKPDTPEATRAASVSADKARLFQAPSLDSRTRIYLVKGDQIEIIDDSKFNTGWCKVRYVPKTGKVIEAWMQSSDLDRSQK